MEGTPAPGAAKESALELFRRFIGQPPVESPPPPAAEPPQPAAAGGGGGEGEPPPPRKRRKAELSAEQREVMDYVMRGSGSVFVTGGAGTGKSMLLKRTVESLESAGRLVSVTAPTGIAAVNVGGVTLHSFAGIGLAPEKQDLKRLVGMLRGRSKDKYWCMVRMHTLVIDEVSMVDPVFLDMLNAVLKEVRQCPLPFGGVQIVMFGDFFQLPPVNKRDRATAQPPAKDAAASNKKGAGKKEEAPITSRAAASMVIVDEGSSHGGDHIRDLYSAGAEPDAREFVDEFVFVGGGGGGGGGGGAAAAAAPAPAAAPVLPDYAFESKAWKELNPRIFNLTHVFRQEGDESFVRLLRRVRVGEPSDEDVARLHRRVRVDVPGSTVLYPLRRDTDESNTRMLNDDTRCRGDPVTFHSRCHVTQRDRRCAISNARICEIMKMSKTYPDEVRLRVGAQVMLTKNLDAERRLVNGSIGRVLKFHRTTNAAARQMAGRMLTMAKQAGLDQTPEEIDGEFCDGAGGGGGGGGGGGTPFYPTVLDYDGADDDDAEPIPVVHFQDSGMTLPITRVERKVKAADGSWRGVVTQVPLQLSWVSTIHKSQGLTLSRAQVDLSGKIFAAGQGYVALSRVTSLQGLSITSLNPQSLRRVDPKVRAFYETFNGHVV